MENLALRLAQAFSDKNDKLEELKIVVDICPVATFITDVYGEFLYVNNAYKMLVGRSSAEVLGDGWKMSVHPDDIDSISSLWQRSVNTSSIFEHDYRCVDKDGTVIPVHCHAAKLPANGYVGYISAIEGSDCVLCRVSKRVARETVAA